MNPLYQPLMRMYKATIIAFIWFCGISFASPQLYVSRVRSYMQDNRKVYECNEHWPFEFGIKLYTIMVFVLTFLAPLIILFFVYTSIFVRISRHVLPGNPDSFRDIHHLERRSKVLKMLIVIVVLFAICWSPIHIFTMAIYLKPNLLKVRSYFEAATFYVLWFTVHFISMVHSVINPIVYCYVSENFQQFLCKKVCSCKRTIVAINAIEMKANRIVEDRSGNTLTSYNSKTNKMTKVTNNKNHQNNMDGNDANDQPAQLEENEVLQHHDENNHQNHLKCHRKIFRIDRQSRSSSSITSSSHSSSIAVNCPMNVEK